MSIIKHNIARILKRQIKYAVESQGYRFFDGNTSWNLNIIGIRSNNKDVNHFDDNIVVVYRNSKKSGRSFARPQPPIPV